MKNPKTTIITSYLCDEKDHDLCWNDQDNKETKIPLSEKEGNSRLLRYVLHFFL